MEHKFKVSNLDQDDLLEIWPQIQRYSAKRKELRPREIEINDLLRNGFGDKKIFHAFVLRGKSSDSTGSYDMIVGYAFYFYYFSTWAGSFINVEDMIIFTDDQNLELYFIKEFLQTVQTKSLPRLDFQVPRSDIESSKIVPLGFKPLPEWYDVRFSTSCLQSLTSTSNKHVHEKYHIRGATPVDMESVLFLIQCLAEYENESDAPELNKEDLMKELGQRFQCFVVEVKSEPFVEASTTNGDLKSNGMPHNPAIVGMSFYCTTFCKRVGRVLHIEDLFVLPQYRHQGLGTELIKETAKVALSTGCIEMKLKVLDWNANASDFYVKLGGEVITDEVMARIERKNFEKLRIVLENK